MFKFENLEYFNGCNNKVYIIGEICNKLSNKKFTQINKYCKYILYNNNNDKKIQFIF